MAHRKSLTELKQAQGAVDNGQQLLYAQVRTLRQDLADRYGTLVPINSPVFTWLVKHAQFLLNNFAIRSDGLTPFESRWSKRCTSALRKFGEIVLCIDFAESSPKPIRLGSLVCGWEEVFPLTCTLSEPLLGCSKQGAFPDFPFLNKLTSSCEFQAKPWAPKGQGEDTDRLVLLPIQIRRSMA